MALLINGEFVDDSAIRQEASALRPRVQAELEEMDPIAAQMQLWEWAQDAVVERILLRQAALASTEPLDEELVLRTISQMFPPAGDLESCEPGATRAGVDPVEARKEVEARLRVDQLIERLFASAPRPKPKEVLDFYKQHRDAFQRPPMVQASHIVKNVTETTTEEDALAAIQKAQEALRDGKPFAEVADEISDCAGQGGMLGWFPLGEMVDEFDNVVFALQPGETSPVFRTEFGYHIAVLHDRKPGGLVPLDEVRDQIEQELLRARHEEIIGGFLENLRSKAEVKKAKAPLSATT
ncbi:MAG TPA: peptidylprolyl isomerase [Bryobacteraceae bacterium]|nr:peptidylprolyl isomerase [Bryobacteraceae bacterium]